MLTIIVRILLGFAAGFLLGFERQIHRQPAGLKTHILICTGSTLLMIVSIMIAGGVEALACPGGTVGDPGRIAAQVVSGIGFLGGGAIIRQGFNIRGLTTAATIWVSAAIGLAIGMGAYIGAAVSVACALFTLFVLERFESVLFPTKNIKTLYLVYDEKKMFDFALLERELAAIKVAVGNIDVSKTIDSDRIRLSIQVHIPAQIDISVLTETLQKAGKLLKMELTTNEKSRR